MRDAQAPWLLVLVCADLCRRPLIWFLLYFYDTVILSGVWQSGWIRITKPGERDIRREDNQTQTESFLKSREDNTTGYKSCQDCVGNTGCPKKKGDPRLMGYTGHQKWTKHKSWVSFGKFRKFPFQWTQKLPIFVKKQLRKLRSNMATPPLKYGFNWGHPADSSFAHNSLNFWLQMRKALPMQYCNNTQN